MPKNNTFTRIIQMLTSGGRFAEYSQQMGQEQRNVLIRALSAEDYEAWRSLWKGYQTFYEASLPEEVTRESFRRMLDLAEPTYGALAWQGDRAIGMVHWIFHRSNWSIGDYCYLQDLYVDETSRGLGVGGLLIEHVYADARRIGASRVYWLTHETNKTAMLLYDRVAERSGFVQYKKSL
jgi:GNAT superfamily N-acetyltransferase